MELTAPLPTPVGFIDRGKLHQHESERAIIIHGHGASGDRPRLALPAGLPATMVHGHGRRVRVQTLACRGVRTQDPGPYLSVAGFRNRF